MAQSVGQRRQEFGVRQALGATPRDILRLVFSSGAGMTVAGLVAGVVLALGSTRLLESLLYGVTPLDPATFAVVAAVPPGGGRRRDLLSRPPGNARQPGHRAARRVAPRVRATARSLRPGGACTAWSARPRHSRRPVTRDVVSQKRSVTLPPIGAGVALDSRAIVEWLTATSPPCAPPLTRDPERLAEEPLATNTPWPTLPVISRFGPALKMLPSLHVHGGASCHPQLWPAPVIRKGTLAFALQRRARPPTKTP